MIKLIIVDQKDKILGLEEKVRIHQGKGILHRAFSVVVVDNGGKILIQQRSRHKLLWPLFWSNTCCSHPVKNENLTKQAEKRLKQEMGFTVPLKSVFKFHYRAKYKNIGSENELVTVLTGNYRGQNIKPDPKEAADYKWIKYKKLLKIVDREADDFTPWFKKILHNEKFALIMQELCGK